MEARDVDQPERALLSIRIDCVTRTDRVSRHHRIRAVGGRGRDGERWRLSEEAAIAAIENERATFYIERDGGRLQVVVAEGLGKRYLKTESDRESPDLLLALSSCD